MQKKPVVVVVVAAFAMLALGLWWYFANQNSQSLEAVTVDRTALIRPHSPSMGKADAPVVIVEYFDPACETCRTFYPMVKQLMAQHPDRIRLVMRYAPFHKGSDKVVAVLEAARRQGKFWPVLEALLQNQKDWVSNHTARPDLIWPLLDGAGLNMEQLAIDLTAPDLQQVVAQDLADANTLGVSQTPEYFVNGRPLPSFGFEQLQQLVREELARAN
ncbi:MAG: thioredoxin domain-containing protein [Rhodoferax sp.]|uniref:DsbA family protein n=1 Tax=Rhodoferax sp. TaxID=50421 RepID=UPI0027170FEA|nr:thioredoxin domain-containing protein [Rhodoferax sp.]MDO8449245.1 thioredoxin domain-containing protein [Rhodoferax sp.]